MGYQICLFTSNYGSTSTGNWWNTNNSSDCRHVYNLQQGSGALALDSFGPYMEIRLRLGKPYNLLRCFWRAVSFMLMSRYTLLMRTKQWQLLWKCTENSAVTWIHLGNLMGVCFHALACAINASYAAAARCQASESWLPSNCSNKSPYGHRGFQHRLEKEKTTIGDIDLLSICPVPRLGDILLIVRLKQRWRKK